MSWSDPARRFEPAEDVQLRAELRDLLGLGAPVAVQTVEPTPELQGLWSRAPAALPLLAALAGLGNWGIQQKHRADELTVQAQRQEQELTRLAASHATEVARERQAKEEVQQKLQLASRKSSPKTEPYLVIPVEKPLKGVSDDYQRVKQKP